MKVAPGPSRVTGRGLIAQEWIAQGEPILDIREDEKLPAPLFHHTNHACDPNAKVTFKGQLQASTTIAPGDEVTIDYRWSCDFTEGFECDCDSCSDYFDPQFIEKKFNPDEQRVAPGLLISGQPGAVVLRMNGKVLV